MTTRAYVIVVQNVLVFLALCVSEFVKVPSSSKKKKPMIGQLSFVNVGPAPMRKKTIVSNR